MRPEGECSERPGRGGDGGFSTPGTAGAGPRLSSLASRAGRHTRPAGVGVAAAASLSSGCHRLASAPHPAPAAAAAAATTTAPGERVPKAPARPTWSSPRERYGAPEETSWKSGPHMRAPGSLPENPGVCAAYAHCVPRCLQIRIPGSSERYADAHRGFGAAKSGGEGAASFEDRKADNPAAKNRMCGCPGCEKTAEGSEG